MPGRLLGAPPPLRERLAVLAAAAAEAGLKEGSPTPSLAHALSVGCDQRGKGEAGGVGGSLPGEAGGASRRVPPQGQQVLGDPLVWVSPRICAHQVEDALDVFIGDGGHKHSCSERGGGDSGVAAGAVQREVQQVHLQPEAPWVCGPGSKEGP